MLQVTVLQDKSKALSSTCLDFFQNPVKTSSSMMKESGIVSVFNMLRFFDRYWAFWCRHDARFSKAVLRCTEFEQALK